MSTTIGYYYHEITSFMSWLYDMHTSPDQYCNTCTYVTKLLKISFFSFKSSNAQQNIIYYTTFKTIHYDCSMNFFIGDHIKHIKSRDQMAEFSDMQTT